MRAQTRGGVRRAAASRVIRRTVYKVGFILAAVSATAATCGKAPTAPGGSASLAGTSPSVAPAPTTYYVSPAGNDANPGTQSQPFQTIQRAADVVNPGETVIVEDGTYTGTGAATACASSNSRPVVCLTRGGTSTARVTFRSLHPLGAKIDGQANTSTYGFDFLAGANYIRLEGFDVFGMGSASGDASGFVIYQGGQDIVIARNDIHDIGRLCTDTTNGETGIFIANARVTVDSNRIHDIGRFAPGENGCQPTTTYYQNHDHGLYINGNAGSGTPGASDVTVTNNLFWNVVRGWPIQVYPGAVPNVSILNNTFANGNPYSEGQIIIGASTTNARIENNIFSDPLVAAINFYSGTHGNLTVANNLSSLALATLTPPSARFEGNIEGVDPMLTASLQPDSASPAIDKGLSLPEVAADIIGTTRPQGGAWDIGAYEFVKPAAASAPVGVRLLIAPGDMIPGQAATTGPSASPRVR